MYSHICLQMYTVEYCKLQLVSYSVVQIVGWPKNTTPIWTELTTSPCAELSSKWMLLLTPWSRMSGGGGGILSHTPTNLGDHVTNSSKRKRKGVCLCITSNLIPITQSYPRLFPQQLVPVNNPGWTHHVNDIHRTVQTHTDKCLKELGGFDRYPHIHWKSTHLRATLIALQ